MIRWYLRRPATGPGLMVIVERVSDRRGSRLLCSDRHHAREELPYLKRLVESIYPTPQLPARTFDPVDADADA